MTEGINEKYYRGPYIIRPDEAAPAAFAELAGSPENEVTDETKAELYDYEHRLFDHVLETGITIGDVFRSRLEDETVSPKFYLDYFNEDPDGNKLARQLLRI